MRPHFHAASVQGFWHCSSAEALAEELCQKPWAIIPTDTLADAASPRPLTPNHLLTMKSKVVLSPPGIFPSSDLYCRKRWRRVQHLANEFWTRWRKEFLLGLKEHQHWTCPRRDLCIGDIMIVKDDNLPCSSWQLTRISNVHHSSDDRVRKVQIALADCHLNSQGKRTRPIRYHERPVQKLILLMPVEQQIV